MSERKGTASTQRGKAAPPRDYVSVKPQKEKSGLFGRIVRRFFLLLFTLILMVVIGLGLILNTIFHGPSPAAVEKLTMSLLEPSATKWIPALFIGKEAVEEIRTPKGQALTDDFTDTSKVIINKDTALSAAGDEWEGHPDGIRIEDYKGKTFNAHIMVVRDPAQVYMGISNKNGFSRSVPGKRPNVAIEDEGALAVINAGAFFDNGTANPEVGSTPEGLVYSEGSCVWTNGAPPNATGFAGFNTDNILVVSTENMTKAKAEELNIRDGCCFGPALIINGEVNQEAYSVSGLNPRTAIGQRADGAVVFICVDGRQAGSIGGSYADVIDIMVEYGVVNACNMDGGSSSVMMYRDTYGLYGEPGQVQMINVYSKLQAEPRRMPDFWMVRPAN